MMWWTSYFEEVWTAQYLPSNSTAWERTVDAVDADMSARDPWPLIAAARSPVHAPSPWVAYLAAERSVDEFTGAWPEARQRAAVADSFPLHRVKGTRLALDRALVPFGYDLAVTEWFEANHLPVNTFSLRVTIGDDDLWQQEDHDVLVRIANKAKNAHTKLQSVVAARKAKPSRLYIGGYLRMKVRLRIEDRPPTIAPIRSFVFVGGAMLIRQRLRISARIEEYNS